MSQHVLPDVEYGQSTVFHAEGSRVAIVVCMLCGAAILIDPREKVDAPGLHRAWHSAQAPSVGEKP